LRVFIHFDQELSKERTVAVSKSLPSARQNASIKIDTLSQTPRTKIVEHQKI
jgi:hypothetical protein